MGCCIVAGLLGIGPRFALFLTWILTNRVDRAFDTFLLAVLGWIFLPWTTLFYVFAYAPVSGVTGIGWFFVAAGFAFDLATWFGGDRSRRQRSAAV